MRRTRFLLAGLLTAAALIIACSGADNAGPLPGGGTAGVSMVMGDTPPAGVTVFSFEITLTSAVLQPGNVSLLASPIEVEVKRLEVETAFLTTVNVTAGRYDGVELTFANPELTILNNSGQAIGTCANGQVCELNPALSPAMVTVTSAPFPLNVQANSPIGLLLDFDLQNSISSTLAISPAVSFTTLPPVQGTGQLEEIEDLVGRVTAKNASANEFTLQLTLGGRTLTIDVDSNTRFDDFADIGCSANNFTCVQVGQIVEVDLRLLAGGMLLASKVELEDDVNQEELEGVIFAIDSLTQFRMVVLDEVPDIAGVAVGNVATVTIQSGANFRIDEDGLTVPTDLAFASAGDLHIGQNVQVRRRSGSSGLNITTDRVRLRMSRFTARVKTPGPQTFIVDNLPSLFTGASPSILEIEVRTSTETDFDDVANAASLAVGNTVSLRGLLFRRLGGSPSLVAKKVRLRP